MTRAAGDEDAAITALVERMGHGGPTATPYAVAYGYLASAVSLHMIGKASREDLARDASRVEVALIRYTAMLRRGVATSRRGRATDVDRR